MKDPKFHGIISTVVTPFDENDAVDHGLLKQDVDYLVESGITAICATGSTGEGHTLSLEESVAVARTVIDAVGGRIPVISGIIQNSLAQAKRYGLALKDAGVDALQITPVHYVFAPSPEETVEYYRELGAEIGLPIILYNVVPWALVPVDTIELIGRAVPEVVAIKQSGGDMHLLGQLLHRTRDRFTILAALDDLHYPAFLMGAHGALAAIPTVTPKLSVQLWDAVQQGDLDTARDLHERILTVWTAIDRPNLPATLKAALELQGRPAGYPRKPFTPATDEDRTRIAAALRAAGVIGG
ncbi:dihydrodipicolinate synthase family protein [Microlunatus soli]|uniref:4-hydroxy-tetrahydrodipicolinate synthase n=1 Tax=Microlunatus soli TaxID=630515 RepID=A0A1H1TVA6_9ACTN|nr:dihydrodipicolinate synthase family protein [Microlunatus soli]SDS64130.1 4-hydroxy-tetrahydrodipicolinate synthase [Microlunatus soli]